MKKTLAILLVLSMLLGLAACTSSTTTTTPEPATTEPAETAETTPTPETTEPAAPARENEERYGGDIIMATNLIATSVDPHFCGTGNANLNWIKNLYEGPIVTGGDGKVYPLMCDYEYAEDGLSLKLTMKEYYFSNGEQVDIEDVVASIERAGNRPSFQTKFWNYVEDVKVEGDSVTYYFNAVCPILLTNFGDIEGPVWVMPKEVCEKYPEECTDFHELIGTGPYILEKWEPETEIIEVRNENYKGVDAGGPGPANVKHAYADRLIWSVNTNSASITAGMIAGDYTVGSVTTEMQPYAEQIGLQKWLRNNQWTHYIYFNLNEENKDSIVQNADFRKAIRAAIDCDEVMFAISNGDPDTHIMDPCPVADTCTAYHNDILKDNAYDLADMDLARQYLEASGYNGEEVTYLVREGSAYYRAAMVIVPKLEELGINVNLWVVDAGSAGALREDPASGYDISFWETQSALDHPMNSNSAMGMAKGNGWTTPERIAITDVLFNTPWGSEENIKAFEDLEWLVVEECPYICFGKKASATYTVADFVVDYEGISAYYWNSYFVK